MSEKVEIFTHLFCNPHPCAVALGSFDGIHIGHCAVINATVRNSVDGLIPTVFTFKENPSALLSGKPHMSITTNKDRYEIFEKSGIRQLYEIDFDSIQNLSPDEFVSKILYETLNAKQVFCGFNYRFGADRAGDFDMLSSICAKHGITAHCIAPIEHEGSPVSSTRIRKALAEGNIQSVNSMLGRCYSLSLPISEGNKLGRTLGFPTLNQRIPEYFIKPRFGVYASAYIHQGNCFCAVTNIGIKPTVGGKIPLAETWVLGTDLGDMYGNNAQIILLDFIRDEKKFKDITELKNAVIKDGKKAKEIYIKQLSENRIIF